MSFCESCGVEMEGGYCSICGARKSNVKVIDDANDGEDDLIEWDEGDDKAPNSRGTTITDREGRDDQHRRISPSGHNGGPNKGVFIVIIISVIVVLLLLSAGIFGGVMLFLLSNDGGSEDDEGNGNADEDGEVLIRDNVKVIDGSTDLVVELIDEDFIRFAYIGDTPDLEISEGDILVSSQSGGYIRKVDSVTDQDGVLMVSTSPASLVDAVEKGQVEASISLTDEDYESAEYGGTRSSHASGKLISIEDETILEYGPLSAKVDTAEISFNPIIDVDIGIGFNGLEYFKAVATGTLDFDLTVSCSATASFEYEKEILIGSYSNTFVQMVGFVPIVEVLTIEFYAGMEASGNYKGVLQTGFDATATLSVGAEYDNGYWTEIKEYSQDFNGHAPTFTQNGDVFFKAYVRPEIKLEFYDMIGPSFDLIPYLQLNGELEGALFSWELIAGLESNIYFNVHILDWELASFERQLFDWTSVLLDGEVEIGMSIDDGTMEGINGYEVEAIISADPNTGEYGTPVTITIEFLDGGYLIDDIECYEYGLNDDDFRYNSDGDPDYFEENLWVFEGYYLTDEPFVIRYYGYTLDGDQVAVGDLSANGGCEVPDWDEDGI